MYRVKLIPKRRIYTGLTRHEILIYSFFFFFILLPFYAISPFDLNENEEDIHRKIDHMHTQI